MKNCSKFIFSRGEIIKEYNGYLNDIDKEIGQKRREIERLITQRKRYQGYVKDMKSNINHNKSCQ